MARIDYAVSVKPIQSTTLEGKTVDAIESDTGSLGGGKSNTTWDGSVTYSHKQSRTASNSFAVLEADNGAWIKHTGFKYDSGLSTVAETTTVVIVSIGLTTVCKLDSGQGVFLPNIVGSIILTDDSGGSAVAVEVAVFT